MKSAVIIGSIGVLAFASPAPAGDASGEITNAAMHAGLAAQASDIAGVHTHLHHTVNCLVGPGGAGFDAKELNPCANTGGGAIPDTADAATKQKLQDALAKANSGIAATDFASAQKDAAATEAALKTVK
ncbi:MAG TPA: hypothetical protein VKR31_05420 [Rhizomicrobium sp.]|nr:hypothetical protein [Rhizomicrobium sp.]